MKRRRQNRKKGSDGFFFPAPLALILAMVTVGVVAWIWMSARCEVAGRRIQELERQKVDLHQRVLNEEYKWANLKSLPNVQQALRRHNLNMSWPSANRVVTLARPALPPRMDAQPVLEYAHLHGGLND